MKASGELIPVPSGVQDFTGKQFLDLTVIGLSPKSGTHKIWTCRCKCGSLTDVSRSNLGKIRSCGCSKKNKPAGFTRIHAAEFRSWAAMVTRCTNPNQKTYARYGARGITVDERWRKSFRQFFEDMGPKPSPRHSIDRINVYGNYEPGNCRWATDQEQGLNRSDNVRITYKGITKTATEWAEETGIESRKIRWRIQQGYSLEDVFSKDNLTVRGLDRKDGLVTTSALLLRMEKELGWRPASRMIRYSAFKIGVNPVRQTRGNQHYWREADCPKIIGDLVRIREKMQLRCHS